MTAIPDTAAAPVPRSPRFRPGAGKIGAALFLLVAVPCFVTLPWSLARYDRQRVTGDSSLAKPSWSEPFGTDLLGRSLLWRCLAGGAISLGIGVAAAVISVIVGVTWGAVAGYAGGRTDALMMRIVDILHGLPYILLVVIVSVAIDGLVDKYRAGQNRLKDRIQAANAAEQAAAAAHGTPEHADLKRTADALREKTPQRTYKKPWVLRQIERYPHMTRVVTLLVAIGGVSWLTMSRVIRGQVLSLRSQPFVEAARACGLGPVRIFVFHLLPNLVGPIVVYATLTVPAAILQESFLSFLGIGVQPPLPSWGNLASEGLGELHALAQTGVTVRWWLMLWPCALLGLTLMALNFLGDALRERLDPRRVKA